MEDLKMAKNNNEIVNNNADLENNNENYNEVATQAANNNTQNIEVGISFKKRLSLTEAVTLINDVVKTCFTENSNTHRLDYNPIILDFRIKSAIVLYYSNYTEQMTKYLEPYFGDDKEGLVAAVNDINRMYDFCCDRMALTSENLQVLGLDVEQVSSIISAIENIVEHKKALIENRAGFVYFVDKLEQDMKIFNDGLKDILNSVSDIFNNVDSVDSDEFKKELLKLSKINSSATVDKHIKESPLLNNNESKVSKANGKRKKKVIPMSDYTQGDKNG